MKIKLPVQRWMQVRVLMMGAVALLTTIDVPAQYSHRSPDRITVEERIRFTDGRSSAFITKIIRRGTTHNYILRGRAGQTLSVALRVKGRTSLTIYTPTDRIWEADGVTEWSGALPETGDYTIQIATDNTTRYSLESRVE
ncbi:MAG: hypothetical protein M3458_02650 [Acidobacteriota bacterium]|nr:hypothetical protein [Acidobacteriota bacterium]